MDTSETYIKMCEKAEEIQPKLAYIELSEGRGKHYYRDRDWLDGDFWAKYDKGLGYVTGVAFACDDDFYSEPEGNVIWLPRQDQLQILSGLSWQDFDKECLKYDAETKEQAGIQVVIERLDKTTR